MLKTVKSLRFLFYLQPKTLARQSFTDAGSRLETPGSERKNFKKTFKIQQAGQCELWVCISSSSLSKSQGGKAEQGETTYSAGLYHSWGTSAFYNRLQAKSPNLWPRGKHYLYYTRQQQTCLCSRNTISIFQGDTLYKYPWKDHPEQKAVSASAHTMCKTWETHGEWSPQHSVAQACKFLIWGIERMRAKRLLGSFRVSDFVQRILNIQILKYILLITFSESSAC